MILTELSSVDASILPLNELSEHLRLGTGFVETSLQDELLEAYIRAAVSAIETRTGLVVFEKTLAWQLTAWRSGQKQILPARPISSIIRVVTFDSSGGSVEHAPESYRLQPDSMAPALVSRANCLPTIAIGGSAEVEFVAGFGPNWLDVPAGLRHAIILLASYYYENRMGGDVGGFPLAVLSLLEGYRPIRMMGGV